MIIKSYFNKIYLSLLLLFSCPLLANEDPCEPFFFLLDFAEKYPKYYSRDLEVILTDRFILKTIHPHTDFEVVKHIWLHPAVQNMSGDIASEAVLYKYINHSIPNLSFFHYDHAHMNLGIYDREALLGTVEIGTYSPEAFANSAPLKDFSSQIWLYVAYHIHPDFWGRGTATDVVRTLSKVAFTTIQDHLYKHDENATIAGIVGATATNNVASQKVLAKNGFKYIGPGVNDASTIWFALRK